MIPTLAGIHHLKLPVRDLRRSQAWYTSRLGYATTVEFVEDGTLVGIGLTHPDGGPDLALRLDAEWAQRSAGFDFFAIGVPTRDDIERLAAHLTALGEEHAGVHFASIGWILPMLHDPDGHEVRFYTKASHLTHEAGEDVLVFHDPRESSETLEKAVARQPG